jgi:hypothetical protein
MVDLEWERCLTGGNERRVLHPLVQRATPGQSQYPRRTLIKPIGSNTASDIHRHAVWRRAMEEEEEEGCFGG